MLLFGARLADEAYRMGTGALAGIGVALALYGLGRGPWRKRAGAWLWRAGVAALVLALAQFLAMATAESWDDDRKFRASAEFSMQPKLFHNTLIGHSNLYKSLDDSLQSLGSFHGGDLLAILDAALVGIVLTLGMGLGLAVAVRLLDRYRILAGRVDDE
jgi:hypothetical protein